MILTLYWRARFKVVSWFWRTWTYWRLRLTRTDVTEDDVRALASDLRKAIEWIKNCACPQPGCIFGDLSLGTEKTDDGVELLAVLQSGPICPQCKTPWLYAATASTDLATP